MPMRPVLSGICLGLLSYKPQYGLLFPLVLIAASQWTVFVTAAIVAVAMAALSWLAFGTESWQAFFHWLPMFSQAFLTEGKAPWWKLQSLFALVRFFGGTEQLAWILQWIMTAIIGVGLVLMWRSPVRYSLKAAALAAGTLLTTPYLFMYDTMVLAIAVAFLVRIGLKTGFRRYELPALACAFALIVTFIFTGAPVGLGATLIVAGLVLRRASPWWRRAAAREAAADGGMAAVQIAPVAIRASVAAGTVYRYFPSKADLISELIADVSRDELAAIRRAADAAPGPSSALAAAVTTVAVHVLSQRKLAWGILAEPVDVVDVTASRLASRREISGEIAARIDAAVH